MGYSLLNGIRVLEVSLLAPDSVGQHLADMGAEVIKIEAPPRGDHVRGVSPTAVGEPGGPSLLHLTWNRGKRSVGLDLRHAEGQAVFLELVRRSHVVIEGLRAGTLQAWGLGLARLQAANPALVYCTLSGTGRDSPYTRLGSHGVFFDAYAGLVPPHVHADGSVRLPVEHPVSIGIHAGGLQAAVGVLSALVRAVRTGQGAVVDVAELDAAALWDKEGIEWAMNEPLMHRRATYAQGSGRPTGLNESVRYSYYLTGDDRLMLFQAPERKFFENFCRAVQRPELIERFPGSDYDQAAGNEALRAELQGIFRTRTQAQWTELFIRANVAGGPALRPAEIAGDPHFQARANVYTVQHPRYGTLHLTSTPIKIAGETFAAQLAPEMGADTGAVLRELLGYDDARIAALAAAGAINASPASGAGAGRAG
ncbi:MAG: CaiB/BaiF CoA transferase family protein [Gammaproteobacteria bacterium]